MKGVRNDRLDNLLVVKLKAVIQTNPTATEETEAGRFQSSRLIRST